MTLVKLLWMILASSIFGRRAMATSSKAKNVLDGPLKLCSAGPKTTGFYRDGFCHTGPDDAGRHVVAAQLTAEFLAFTASRGNDLSTPRLPYFPGLNPGDRWCLCALRWKEAYDAGVAPPVDLEATNAAALRYVTLDQLKEHALPSASSTSSGNTSDGGTANVSSNGNVAST